MSTKRTGGCKCRSRRGRKKAPYRSPEQAAWAIEQYELTNAEVYPCPAPGDRWHLRHAKSTTADARRTAP